MTRGRLTTELIPTGNVVGVNFGSMVGVNIDVRGIPILPARYAGVSPSGLTLTMRAWGHSGTITGTLFVSNVWSPATSVYVSVATGALIAASSVQEIGYSNIGVRAVARAARVTATLAGTLTWGMFEVIQLQDAPREVAYTGVVTSEDWDNVSVAAAANQPWDGPDGLEEYGDGRWLDTYYSASPLNQGEQAKFREYFEWQGYDTATFGYPSVTDAGLGSRRASACRLSIAGADRGPNAAEGEENAFEYAALNACLGWWIEEGIFDNNGVSWTPVGAYATLPGQWWCVGRSANEVSRASLVADELIDQAYWAQCLVASPSVPPPVGWFRRGRLWRVRKALLTQAGYSGLAVPTDRISLRTEVW